MTTLNKQEVAKLVASGVLRETFTSSDYHSPIDITFIREALAYNPTRWTQTIIPLSAELIAFLYRAREIDDERVMLLTEDQINDPIFVATFQDGKPGVCPIDGHHRMVRRFRQGLTTVLAYLIPWQQLPVANRQPVEWGNKQVDLKTKGWRNDGR